MFLTPEEERREKIAMTLPVSPALQAANEAFSAACALYDEAVDKYRAMEIGDDEFIAARTAYNAALKAYDEAAAIDSEQAEKLIDEIIAAEDAAKGTAPANQLSLF